MEDVVPKLTESEMAHMASGGSKGITKFFGSLVEDTLGEVEWRKLMDEFLEKNVGSFVKKYVDNSSIDPYWFKKHDWHPLTKEKELIWEMPEGVTKKEDIFWDQDLISERFGKPKRTSSGAWRGDPHVSGWGGVQEFLDNYKGEFGDIEWQKNFGKMYEKVPYNEFDAFGDTIEQMLHKIFGDEMVPTGEKFFTDMETIMGTLRKQIAEVKIYQEMYDTSPPQYKADQLYMLQHPKEQLNRTLKLIKDAISKKENAPYHPFADPPGKISMNSRGGLHGYAKGGKIGEYFVREPVKAVGKFLKDNIPPVFEKFVDYLPKITGTTTKYSAQKNVDTGSWDIGTVTGKKKIEVDRKWVKNPDYFKATETGFKAQTSANKAIKKLQKQQVSTVTKPDKAEGALVWKSRESIADAPFQIAPKKQWLDYLVSRGVGYKELSDTSLFLTKSGLAEDGTTPIRIPEGGFLSKDGDFRISKADLLKEFDELVPKIKVHLLGNRNFSDGLKFIANSLTKKGKGKKKDYGEGFEEIEGAVRHYLDYPRADFDVRFEGLLKQVSTLIERLREAGTRGGGRGPEGEKAFDPVMVENVVDQINGAFKAQYGVENVIGKGVSQTEHPNLPFEVVKLGNNLADIFSKRGIQYRQLGQPQHEGDQILQGGYNHNELVFTFEPGKSRAGEVSGYKPSHEFGLGKDAEGGFVHARISDRIDEAGRKILFVEEIQSDMHQAVQNKNSKYKPRLDRESPDVEKIKELKGLTKILKKELKNVQKNLEKAQASETKGRTPEEIQMRQDLINDLEIKRDSMMEEMKGQAKDLKKLEGTGGGTIPEGPFKMSKDYAKFVIKYLLKMARENGYDGVGVSNAWIKARNLSPGGKDFEGHFGFYGNWGPPDPAVPASFKDVILKDAMGEVSRDSKTKLSLTAIKDHEKGKTWGDIPVLLLTRGKNKEIIEEAAKRIDKGQSAYYKGGLVREVFQDVVPAL